MVAAASVYATHRSTVVKLDFMSDNCRCVRSTLVFLGCRTWPTQNHSSCGNVNGACLGLARGAVGALVAPYENRTPGGLGAPYENRTSGAASPPPPPHAPPPRPYNTRIDRYCTRGARSRAPPKKPLRFRCVESRKVYRYRYSTMLCTGSPGVFLPVDRERCKTGMNRSPEL
jgi:hypothetical protein